MQKLTAILCFTAGLILSLPALAAPPATPAAPAATAAKPNPGPVGPPADPKLAEHVYKIYQDYSRELAVCPDVACYKALASKYGSASVRENVVKTDEPKLNQLFEIWRGVAQAETKGDKIDIESATQIDADHLYVVMTRKPVKADGNNYTIRIKNYFTRENGVWKIGR